MHCSGPMPSRSATPGRHPSTRPSASATRSRTRRTPSACLRSTATDRRLRLSRSQCGPDARCRRRSPWPGPPAARPPRRRPGACRCRAPARSRPARRSGCPRAGRSPASPRWRPRCRGEPVGARRALATMAATTSGCTAGGISWPMPGITSNSCAGDGPGRGLATARAARGCRRPRGSTRVGAVHPASAAVRSPDATMAMIWRAVPGGIDAAVVEPLESSAAPRLVDERAVRPDDRAVGELAARRIRRGRWADVA